MNVCLQRYGPCLDNVDSLSLFSGQEAVVKGICCEELGFPLFFYYFIGQLQHFSIIMSIHRSTKSTLNLHSNIEIPPLFFNRSSVQQETLKKGRINHIISDSKNQSSQKLSEKKTSLVKFRGSQQDFKRQKSLYRQMVSRNNSMKLLKQQNTSILDPQLRYKQQKLKEYERCNLQQKDSQSKYDQNSSNCNEQTRARYFKRKNVQNKIISNDYNSCKRNRLLIKNQTHQVLDSKDENNQTNAFSHLEHLQTKQSQDSLREQIHSQQKIINEKSREISQLKSSIVELNGQIYQLNHRIHQKDGQNQKLKNVYNILQLQFSKIINDFHPKKKMVNRQSQDTLIENQIRHIQDQILYLKNGIKYLEICNLTLKKARSEVDLQKSTILKLEENKKNLQKTIVVLKEMNSKKSQKISDFMKQKSLKKSKTQFYSESLFSDNDSDNSLNLSLQDEKTQNTPQKSQLTTQNINYLKLLNASQKRQKKPTKKTIAI